MKINLFKPFLSILLFGSTVFSYSQTITTVAGTGVGGYSGDGGSALSAQMNNPFHLTFDASGNMYVCEETNNTVRKITPGGIITTLAGTGVGGFSGDGGPATSAQLNIPTGAVVDAAGNVYIADLVNNRIRKVTAAGTMTTLAGTGTAGGSGDGGPAISAQLNYPEGVALDPTGNLLYIADRGNNKIRVVNLTSFTIATFAGTGAAGFGGDGGSALSAQMSLPIGVSCDAAGNVYVADYSNNRIRKINTSGIINTIAGNGSAGFGGDGGLATAAQLSSPTNAWADATGKVYIADYSNNRIRLVSTTGTITTYAGTGVAGFSGDGGLANVAQVNGATGGGIDAAGNIYIADRFNDRVRKVNNGCAAVTSSLSSTAIACNGSTTSATITASGGTGFTYSWSPSGGTASVAVGLTAGAYTVTSTNSCSNTISQTFTLSQPPPIVITVFSNNSIVCAGNPSTLTALASGGTGIMSYSWSTGSNFTTTVVNPTVTSVYTIVATDGNGCPKSNTISVTVNTPSVTAASSTSLLCTGQSATLTANGASSYTWSTGSNSVSIVINPTVTTSYTVVGTNTMGCTGTMVVTQSVSTCSGLNELISQNAIRVYPNPNNGIFIIELNSINPDMAIELYNAIGELMYRETKLGSSNRINLKEMASGIYLLKITDNNTLINYSKIIKN